MEIDSDFETDFRQFGGMGTEPEYSTEFNCLDLDSSKEILKKIEKK